MENNPKSASHSKSNSPSESPRTSHSHVGSPVSKQEEEESTTTTQTHHTLEQLSLESPEV